MAGERGELEEGGTGIDEGGNSTVLVSVNGRAGVQYRAAYSRGSIFPRARCLSRAFCGPPFSIRACSSVIRAMTSPIDCKFSLYSFEDVSTFVGRTDMAEAWCS